MRISLLLLSFATCLGFEPDVVVPGDVMLGGLFSIQTYGTARCNQLNPESVQIYQAVRWFIQKLNDRNYLQNVKIGLHAFNTCDEPEYAVQATLKMLELYKNGTIYGVLGPERSSEVQFVSRLLSSLPEESRIPLLSYSATAATLSDKSVYRNLIRVIASDSLQVEVLHQLVLSLQWNYIAIVYEEDTYGIDGAKALRSLLEPSDVCIPVYFGIATDASTEQRRVSFNSLAALLERQSESPVVGLVFIGRGTTANLMFDYLSINLQTFQVIASEALGVYTEYLKNSVGDVYPKAKGILTISPPFYDPLQFKEYWRSVNSEASQLLEDVKDNNWLLSYMEDVTGCRLESETSIPNSCLAHSVSIDDSSMSFYITYALTAVAGFVKTLKELYQVKCSTLQGVCDDFAKMKKSEIIQKFETVTVDSELEFPELANFNRSFMFVKGEIDFIEKDVTSPTYSVYNYQACSSKFCLEKVGDHIKGELMLTKSNIKSYDKSGVEKSGPVEAQCKPSFSCESCQSVGSQGKVYHIPGDFYVVGLAPVHDKGTGPFECGNVINSFGVDIAESIAYAVQRINLKRDRFVSVLGDKTIGLVVLETCNSPIIARERILKLERGELQLDQNRNSSSILGRIIGYVGPYGSALSVPLSSVMTELNKVYISYASTTSSLSSRSTYPNFMRTVAPDYKQADVIMYVAKTLESKYVQIMYSEEEYGRAGLDALLESAKKYEICTAQNIGVPDTTDATVYRKYVSELRRYPHAKVVILFARTHITSLLISALNSGISAGEFIFIGSESWGKRSSVLVNNAITIGSMTLAQELPKNQGFEDHLDDIEVFDTKNPWLQEYMEKKAGCYFPMSFNKISNRECTPSLLAQAQTSDPWVPFAINAVYSLVLGFDTALSAQCPGSVSICPEYNTAALIARVKEVRLDIYNDGGNVRVFDDNGEGNVGYTISQVVRDGGNLVYKKLGDSTINVVRFSASGLFMGESFKSECQNLIECETCNSQKEVQTESDAAPVQDNSAAIGLGVFVAFLLVALIVVVVLFVMRIRADAKKSNQDQDHYLTIVPEQGVSNSSHNVSDTGYVNNSQTSVSDSGQRSSKSGQEPGDDGYSYPSGGHVNPGIQLDILPTAS